MNKFSSRFTTVQTAGPGILNEERVLRPGFILMFFFFFVTRSLVFTSSRTDSPESEHCYCVVLLIYKVHENDVLHWYNLKGALVHCLRIVPCMKYGIYIYIKIKESPPNEPQASMSLFFLHYFLTNIHFFFWFSFLKPTNSPFCYLILTHKIFITCLLMTFRPRFSNKYVF